MPSVAVTTKEILKNHRQWSFYERNIKKITGTEFSMHMYFIALSTFCYTVNKCRHLTWVWFQDIGCAIEKKYYIVMWHLTENSKFSTAYSPIRKEKKWPRKILRGVHILHRLLPICCPFNFAQRIQNYLTRKYGTTKQNSYRTPSTFKGNSDLQPATCNLQFTPSGSSALLVPSTLCGNLYGRLRYMDYQGERRATRSQVSN